MPSTHLRIDSDFLHANEIWEKKVSHLRVNQSYIFSSFNFLNITLEVLLYYLNKSECVPVRSKIISFDPGL